MLSETAKDADTSPGSISTTTSGSESPNEASLEINHPSSVNIESSSSESHSSPEQRGSAEPSGSTEPRGSAEPRDPGAASPQVLVNGPTSSPPSTSKSPRNRRPPKSGSKTKNRTKSLPLSPTLRRSGTSLNKLLKIANSDQAEHADSENSSPIRRGSRDTPPILSLTVDQSGDLNGSDDNRASNRNHSLTLQIPDENSSMQTNSSSASPLTPTIRTWLTQGSGFGTAKPKKDPNKSKIGTPVGTPIDSPTSPRKAQRVPLRTKQLVDQLKLEELQKGNQKTKMNRTLMIRVSQSGNTDSDKDDVKTNDVISGGDKKEPEVVLDSKNLGHFVSQVKRKASVNFQQENRFNRKSAYRNEFLKLIPFYISQILYWIIFYIPADQPSLKAALIKSLPGLTLAFYLATSLSSTLVVKWLFVAMTFAMAGDFCLVFKKYFILCIIFFTLAQLSLIGAFGLKPLKPKFVVVVGLVLLIIMSMTVPNIEDLKIQIGMATYVFIMGTMVWRALARADHGKVAQKLSALGAILLVMAHALVGIHKFAYQVDNSQMIIMSLYYFGLFLINLTGLEAIVDEKEAKYLAKSLA